MFITEHKIEEVEIISECHQHGGLNALPCFCNRQESIIRRLELTRVLQQETPHDVQGCVTDGQLHLHGLLSSQICVPSPE